MMKSRKARRIKEEMNACCTLLARIRETARETESESERERGYVLPIVTTLKGYSEQKSSTSKTRNQNIFNL